MPITDILEKNCRLYGDDVALVEINPEMPETRRVTWKEYELIEPVRASYYRREITWNVFNEKANRFANLLLERGVHKGDKVAILLMNCLEWLPIYFGILKTGALAVPLNFRYSAEEIKYCVELAEVDVLVFGPEFIGRIEEIADEISRHRLLFFVGDGCPGFAEDYTMHSANCSSQSPKIDVTDEDYAAIYFSSGTTGFPKAILHTHQGFDAFCQDRAESSWTDQGRCVFVHPSAVSYRSKDALVRKPSDRGKGCAFKRNQSGVYPAGCFRRKVYHCMASGTVGAGSASGIGQW